MTHADIVLWVCAFLLQGALLGMVMYMLICLSDLENDFMNPYDCANNINRWQVPEFIAQGILSALLLLGGKWFCLLLHLPITLYHARLFMRKEYRVDVTEIFQQSGKEKLRRLVKLGVYFVGFLMVVFRMVEACVWTLLTPEGRVTAHKLLHEAMATMHI